MPYNDPRSSRIAQTLNAAKRRCYNPTDAGYRYYGARGITVCRAWRESTAAFVDWALASGYAPGLYLDRINPRRGYSPTNCRWVTPLDSTRNRKRTLRVTYQGRAQTLADWAFELGVSYSLLHQRYTKGERGAKLFRPAVTRRPKTRPCKVLSRRT